MLTVELKAPPRHTTCARIFWEKLVSWMSVQWTFRGRSEFSKSTLSWFYSPCKSRCPNHVIGNQLDSSKTSYLPSPYIIGQSKFVGTQFSLQYVTHLLFLLLLSPLSSPSRQPHSNFHIFILYFLKRLWAESQKNTHTCLWRRPVNTREGKWFRLTQSRELHTESSLTPPAFPWRSPIRRKTSPTLLTDGSSALGGVAASHMTHWRYWVIHV